MIYEVRYGWRVERAWRLNESCVVTVPPRWLVEPTDVSVERNRHVALHCQAQGVPTPTVVWKKATGLNTFVIFCHVSNTCPTLPTV